MTSVTTMFIQKYFVITARSRLFYGSDFCRGQGAPQMEIWLVLNWEPGAAARACMRSKPLLDK